MYKTMRRGKSPAHTFLVDSGKCRCYISLSMCLPEQTGKELKSMIVREVAAS